MIKKRESSRRPRRQRGPCPSHLPIERERERQTERQREGERAGEGERGRERDREGRGESAKLLKWSIRKRGHHQVAIIARARARDIRRYSREMAASFIDAPKKGVYM